MTNRPSNHDHNRTAGMPSLSEYSRFKVRDSYSVPTTDTPEPGDAPEAYRRLSHKRLEELSAALSDRDREVLLTVQRYRYLMTGQLQRLHFTDATSGPAALRAASRNLKKLKELGLLSTMSRRIGGVRAGSGSLIWHLTHGGERLLRLHDEKAYPCRRQFEPSPYFLAHTLAVAEASVRLTEICRNGKMELADLQSEPECWRAYSEHGTHLALKPDLYAAIVSCEYEDRYFIEIDLDTESPAKVVEKCRKYHQYYRSGLEQKESGLFPLTVWVVPSVARKERLTAHIREEFKGQPRLFSVITDEELEHLIRHGGEENTLC